MPERDRYDIGRGLLEEMMYTLANMLALEEHLAENGYFSEAVDVRRRRIKLVHSIVRDYYGKDVKDTLLRRDWCIVKHLLLISYHAYEAFMMGGCKSYTLYAIYKDMFSMATSMFDALVRGDEDEWEDGEEIREEEEEEE